MARGTTFCDIGSGVGRICLELAKTHPHLKLTLQDQSHVLDNARGVSFPIYRHWLIVTNGCARSYGAASIQRPLMNAASILYRWISSRKDQSRTKTYIM
jgi:hypothetical protein